MPIDPVANPVPATTPPAVVASAATGSDFAAALQTALAKPRNDIAVLRATIAGFRNGGGIALSAPTAATVDLSSAAVPSSATASAADPYGWKQLTQNIGDSMVAPGFGTIFERQIAQESGYDPAVVLGQRRSSAGAEGIAQLMPQYYPGVDRTNPQASLQAAAASMKHYLSAFGGDVRKALAAYNAGMGRVQQLVAAHGADWERALPDETKQYLAAILGNADGVVEPSAVRPAAVFGGRGPGGALTSPLDAAIARIHDGNVLVLRGAGGADVRAPADGVVAAIQPSASGTLVRLDHGNGWSTVLDGLATPNIHVGDYVSRGDRIGALGGDPGGEGMLRFGLSGDGQDRDPQPYLLG